jgi:hypothetical protein
MKNYGKFTLALVIVWFVFALSASALHLFQNNANRIGLTIAFAALLPIAVFALWFALSTSFRLFTMSLNPVLLTAAQSSRILGFVFVLAEARGALPALFALPAGYGDMFIGITAAFAAWQLSTPQHRISFIFWQFLGITDLVTAVSLGVTARFLVPYGPTTAPMTTLPLSLIPTFFVPLYLILHIICIAQAKSWQPSSSPSERRAIQPLQHRPV